MPISPISCNYALLIEEKSFTDKIAELHKDYIRIYDVHTAIGWALGENPKAGFVCDDEPLHRIFKTTPIGNTPSFWVLYRFDSQQQKVFLLSIYPADSNNE